LYFPARPARPEVANYEANAGVCFGQYDARYLLPIFALLSFGKLTPIAPPT